MADAEMWTVAAEAETLLDGPDCDWRTLQQIEGMLSSVSSALEHVAESVCSSHVPAGPDPRTDLQGLQTSLALVRRHEYDALESELQHRLDTALRSAMAMLGWLERSSCRAPLLAARAHPADDDS